MKPLNSPWSSPRLLWMITAQLISLKPPTRVKRFWVEVIYAETQMCWRFESFTRRMHQYRWGRNRVFRREYQSAPILSIFIWCLLRSSKSVVPSGRQCQCHRYKTGMEHKLQYIGFGWMHDDIWRWFIWMGWYSRISYFRARNDEFGSGCSKSGICPLSSCFRGRSFVWEAIRKLVISLNWWEDSRSEYCTKLPKKMCVIIASCDLSRAFPGMMRIRTIITYILRTILISAISDSRLLLLGRSFSWKPRTHSALFAPEKYAPEKYADAFH